MTESLPLLLKRAKLPMDDGDLTKVPDLLQTSFVGEVGDAFVDAYYS